MTTDEFLSALTHRLGYLPYAEVKRTVDFYREAIEDRMEDGMTEPEAVAAVGSLDEVVREIEMNLPLSTVVKTRVEDAKERAREERRGGNRWRIAVLILTSPVWAPLLFAAVITVFSLLFAVFSVVLAFAITAVALIGGGLTAAVLAFVLPYPGLAPRLMLSGVGLVIAALGLLFLPVTMLVERAVKGLLNFAVRAVKSCILNKGAAS